MPYHITHNTKECSGYAVVKDSDNEVMGCHKTRKEALAQMAALHANENETTKGLWGGRFI